MNRRQALTVMAVATVHWPRGRQAAAAPPRVRCGTPVTLKHPEAQAFELSTPGRPTAMVPARRGRLVFRAPIAAEPGFHAVVCTPFADGAAIGPAIEVPVYTPRLSWGA